MNSPDAGGPDEPIAVSWRDAEGGQRLGAADASKIVAHVVAIHAEWNATTAVTLDSLQRAVTLMVLAFRASEDEPEAEAIGAAAWSVVEDFTTDSLLSLPRPESLGDAERDAGDFLIGGDFWTRLRGGDIEDADARELADRLRIVVDGPKQRGTVDPVAVRGILALTTRFYVAATDPAFEPTRVAVERRFDQWCTDLRSVGLLRPEIAELPVSDVDEEAGGASEPLGAARDEPLPAPAPSWRSVEPSEQRLETSDARAISARLKRLNTEWSRSRVVTIDSVRVAVTLAVMTFRAHSILDERERLAIAIGSMRLTFTGHPRRLPRPDGASDAEREAADFLAKRAHRFYRTCRDVSDSDAARLSTALHEVVDAASTRGTLDPRGAKGLLEFLVELYIVASQPRDEESGRAFERRLDQWCAELRAVGLLCTTLDLRP